LYFFWFPEVWGPNCIQEAEMKTSRF
jgi:hypothetical protein